MLFQTNIATALKVNTHVWIADEIIEDLEDDNELSIYVNGIKRNIKVNPSLAADILAHRKEFRAGALGPDAFPDILVGQLLIHPGVEPQEGLENSWNTDDWLSYMLDSASVSPDKAFSYGTLVHAASDVVSHTYINLYAGDIFNITDHLKAGAEAERRHFLLESYVGDFTPNLNNNLSYRDSVSIPQSKAYSINQNSLGYTTCILESQREGLPITLCDFYLNRPIAKDYIANTFFYIPEDIESQVGIDGANGSTVRPTHIQEYGDAANHGSLGGLHIKLIYDLRYKIEQLIQSDDLLDIDSADLVYFWTSDDNDLWINNSEIFEILHDNIFDITVDSVDALDSVRDDVEDIIQNSQLTLHGITESTAKNMDSHVHEAIRLQSKIFDLEDDLLDLENRLFRASCPWFDPICNLIADLKDDIRDKKTEITNTTTEFFTSRDLLANTLTELHGLAQSVNLVRRNAGDLGIDIAQAFLNDPNPIRSLLINWAKGIDAAVLSYQSVGMEMMQEAMENGDTLAPLKKWAIDDCNIGKILGWGNALSTSKCALQQSVQTLLDELLFMRPYVGDPIIDAVIREIDLIIEKEIRRLEDKLVNKLVNTTLDAIDPGLASFVEIFGETVTETSLNEEFGLVPVGTDFIAIPDMAARVNSEMRIINSTTSCNGKSSCFDKDKYPLIYNAIQLSKIALLDSEGLSDLSDYIGTDIESFNDNTFDRSLLIGAVKNIDGNHHWYGEKAPPLPSELSTFDWTKEDYGKGAGALLGSTENSRDDILNAVFIGPLNEGLFTPNNLGGYSQLLSNSYLIELNACENHPFQLSQEDAFCDDVPDNPPSDGGNNPAPPPPPVDECWSNPFNRRTCNEIP